MDGAVGAGGVAAVAAAVTARAVRTLVPGAGATLKVDSKAAPLMAPAARRAGCAVCVLPLRGDATMVSRIGLLELR